MKKLTASEARLLSAQAINLKIDDRIKSYDDKIKIAANSGDQEIVLGHVKKWKVSYWNREIKLVDKEWKAIVQHYSAQGFNVHLVVRSILMWETRVDIVVAWY